jgi:type II secretory pathway pseudopilin PulG
LPERAHLCTFSGLYWCFSPPSTGATAMTCTSAQAFIRLLSELDAQIAAASAAGSAAFAAQDVAAAQAAAAQLAALHTLQRQILTAQQRWWELVPSNAANPPLSIITDRLELPEQRAVAEKITPAEAWQFETSFSADTADVEQPTADVLPAEPPPNASSGALPRRVYYRPILQALVELGGRAALETVISMVGSAMAAQLGPEDYRPTAHTDEIRWRNSVRWARQDLVMRGLLLKHSAKRIWEISDLGRQWLAEQE